ncbi:MAG: FHA domain-containing protein [Myxococcales bacterium]
MTVVRGPGAGSAFRLPKGMIGAGSAKGLLLFPDDPYLAPLHATFLIKDSELAVRDEGSPSGTFVRIKKAERLAPGDLFAAGDHLMRYCGPLEPAPPGDPIAYGAPAAPHLFVVEEIVAGGRPGRACARPGPVVSVGRNGSDLSFPGDEHLAARHCELQVDPAGATLRDLGTADGTFVRLPPGAEYPLVPGDSVRIGMQVLRIDLG